MAIVTAFTSVNTNPAPGNTTYLPPTQLALQSATFTASQINVLDPLGRLQQYFGTFDLLSIAAGNYTTSTFTGFKQFTTASSSSPLALELSGASLNGQLVFGLITANDVPALVSTLLGADDQITGSLEADSITGFAGSDVIKGLAGSDSIVGDIGSDTMNGNQGDDTVRGSIGDDVVRGGKDNDQLFGDDGADRIIGGLGNDTSTGGLGADTFVLSGGTDKIEDFNFEENDKIEIIQGTAYTLGSTGLSGAGDLTITWSGGVTTLTGVSLNSFNEAASIVFA